jgi:hypothetical protein
MKFPRKIFALAAAAAITLSGCGASTSGSPAAVKSSSASASSAASAASSAAASSASSASLKLDSSKWNYDETNQVYWQIGLVYCASPEDTSYESMGIYVPAAYMTAQDNGDGTYTCSVNKGGTVGSFTGATAPMVIPVETPGYAACPAPTEYSYDTVSAYLQAGYIYLYAGCRGNQSSMGHTGMTGTLAAASSTAASSSAAASVASSSSSSAAVQTGAPWGVADLKAAIRYVRYNASLIPGDASKVFSFGMSGGGAQSALLGATGDSDLYTPYLNKIGAAMTDDSGAALSDAVCGSMCWCPITSLTIADEAYEWMMGQFETSGTRADGTFTAALSQDMAATFADYINKLGLTDENGNALTLTQSESGVYLSGAYYDYLKSVIETSLNNFLKDTTFPYTPASQGMGGMMGGGMGGRPSMASSSASSSVSSADMPAISSSSAKLPAMSAQSSQSSTTYNTVQDYIDSLNGSTPWITYDAASNTATITSIEAFVQHCKSTTKDVCAFDTLDLSSAENNVFGDASNNAQHFDAYLAQLLQDNQSEYSSLTGWDSSYVTAYQGISSIQDELGTATDVRVNMYDPLYFVAKTCAGSGTSTVAPYWRIRTGIFQGDTSLTTETNLALALKSCSSVKDVDFATVWGLYHTTAERTGDSTTNFIAWVAQCCAK